MTRCFKCGANQTPGAGGASFFSANDPEKTDWFCRECLGQILDTKPQRKTNGGEECED